MVDFCADGGPVITPSEGVAGGCPLPMKQRVVLSSKGVAATIEWQMRDPNGSPIDLSACVCEDSGSSGGGGGGGGGDNGSSSSESSATSESSSLSGNESSSLQESSEVLCGRVLVRFADAFNPHCYVEVEGTITDAEEGLVQFAIPPEVYDLGGIYQMSIGVTNASDDLVAVNKGLLSIDSGLFGYGQAHGPPSLQEIRLQLRDTEVENNLLAAPEFDDAEIIHSLLRPLQEWNERPPPLSVEYNTSNFPYRYNWVNAAIANLLQIAAASYRRNKMQSSQGGIVIDDKNKDVPYMEAAQLLRQEWVQFIRVKKASLNATGAYGYLD